MAYLLARDTVNGAEGKGFVTRGGRVYEVAGFKNVRTTADVQSTDMRVVGTRKIQNKNNGVKLRGTANVYYGTDMWRDMVLEYIKTGKMESFDLEIVNSDPSTSIGTESMAYYGCMLTGEIPLSILDSEEAMLNYDFNFSYDDVEKLSSFTAPEKYGN